MKRILIILASAIPATIVLIYFCMPFRYRTRVLQQEYRWHDGIGIRAEEYRFIRHEDFHGIEGIVRITNASAHSVQGSPYVRVIARGIQGNVYSLPRGNDMLECIWEGISIPPGGSLERQFDAELTKENRLQEFAVRWDANTNVVTGWITL